MDSVDLAEAVPKAIIEGLEQRAHELTLLDENGQRGVGRCSVVGLEGTFERLFANLLESGWTISPPDAA